MAKISCPELESLHSTQIEQKYNEVNFGVSKIFQENQDVPTRIALEGFYTRNKLKAQETRARMKEQEDTSRTADAIEKLNERIEKQGEENKRTEKRNFKIAIITLVIVVLNFAKDIYEFLALHVFG